MATDPLADQAALQGREAWEREAERERAHGIGPWRLALRRLRRNKVALAFGFLFVLLVACCVAAPLWADRVAHTGPNENHLSDTIRVGGETKNVVGLDGIPIGPTWRGEFFLGADSNGRDIMVRLLYGGRNSLMIGIGSALICTLVALTLALLAGYYRGGCDWLISRFFDIIWAFPVLLLAIAISSALSINGFHHFGISIEPGSLWIPTLVISYVLIPYIGRPIRGQILSLREKEFVEAAIGQGAGPLRVMFSDLLPNIASTVLVFFTLIIAANILTEAGLSFLGAGVRLPDPSWGNLIASGQDQIETAPWLSLIPGIAIVLTVLSLNIFGDGLRDALDPRAKVRIEH
jgi:peptide/nickel transport system permease protein